MDDYNKIKIIPDLPGPVVIDQIPRKEFTLTSKQAPEYQKDVLPLNK